MQLQYCKCINIVEGSHPQPADRVNKTNKGVESLDKCVEPKLGALHE